ncbi:hypothetical protein [Oscillatoria sp. FACHB-1406]|uniref:hypothetical protein n=1 Tax=Oscillatoria sp. FACHB-1406 TaxID=2692846 RepID=UPI00168333C1|nr:hypothetical protein [Oscillatoria sp. FACHB-1406]MBD2576572.1 hypothetical protein [Oscillatoria sp. FACHB-1406]
MVCDRTATETATALWKALQEGLIVPISEIYKFYQARELETEQPELAVSYQFLHDRIQQAAYSLIRSYCERTYSQILSGWGKGKKCAWIYNLFEGRYKLSNPRQSSRRTR